MRQVSLSHFNGHHYKRKILSLFCLLFLNLPQEIKADLDFLARGGFLTGIWSIDINSSSYTSTRRGNNAGSTGALSLSYEGELFSLGYEVEQSFQERWHYGDASETNDDNNWSSMAGDKAKYIIFLGLGTTGQNMFSFLSTRLGYIYKAKLELSSNILANNPKATYEGMGVKLSFFYKNIFQTLDWGLDLSLDINYISYDFLSTNGSSSTLPGTIDNTDYSKLTELSGSLMFGISFTFLKNILETQRGGSFFRMPGDS